MTTLTVFELTPLGLFHTVLSIITVVVAFVALYREHGILPRTVLGRTYLATLLITTLTGLPIFRHGTVGPPHILGVVILVVLGVAATARLSRAFGSASAYVEKVSYSFTVFLLMIPTVTETLTRIPPGNPLVASPQAPIFPPLYGALFMAFIVGATWQVRTLRHAPGRLLPRLGR